MRALLQRVGRAAVRIDGVVAGETGPGLVILLGVTHDDTLADVRYLAEKCVHLRIFEDEAGKMNRSVLDLGGGVLIVSQFTLYGDASQGRRPSYTRAARPEMAEPLYEAFVSAMRDYGLPVGTGRFGAEMKLEIHNDGPVTLLVESKK